MTENRSLPTLPTPLVPVSWLSANLGQPGLQVVDASAYLPNAGRDARAEFLAGHIPGAVYADLGWMSDETAPFPHTLLNAEKFASRMGALGIGNDSAVVVYDSSGQNFSAPRFWWMMRTFGHSRVAVLDGGLPAWVAAGGLLDSGDVVPSPAAFSASFDASRVRAIEDMRRIVDERDVQIVDARSAGRFAALEPEPRAGVRGGHMPGARNLHYARLVDAQGLLRSETELRALVADAGIDLTRPIVASCGTGVTACAVVLALEVLGVEGVPVFDGSWTEWGSGADTPVEVGPAGEATTR